MKSVYLLCEYGMPVETAKMLCDNGLTIEKMYYYEDYLDKYISENDYRRRIIQRCIKDIMQDTKLYSIYDLTYYGLETSIADRLRINRIEIDDICDKIKYIYNISDLTYDKIMSALEKFMKSKNYMNKELLLKEIKETFNHDAFTITSLHDELYKKGIENDKIKQILDDLVEEGRVCKDDKEDEYYTPYSVYDLEKYGLSKKIIEEDLAGKNIGFSDIDKDISERFNITPQKSQKILDAYDTMAKKLNIKKKPDNNIVLDLFRSPNESVYLSKKEMTRRIEEKGYDAEEFGKDLDSLVLEGKIVKENGKYRLAYPKLIEEIKKADIKPVDKELLWKRLTGKSLEQLSREYDLPKERIRQINRRDIKKLNYVEEEKYSRYIKKYDFGRELFCQLFNVDDTVYNYLKLKYGEGKESPVSLINDAGLTSLQKDILRGRYNYIRVNNSTRVATSSELQVIIDYLKQENRSVSFDEILTYFNQHVKDNFLRLNFLTKDDLKRIDARLERNKYVLNTLNNCYRYYDYDAIDEEDKAKLKDMLDVEPGAYSADLFFRNNPEFMKKIDIRDKYELHNLCRKVIGNFNKKIKYSRMPDIFIGCNDKFKFVVSKIKEKAPISIDDFVDYLYENYGHQKDSMKAYIINKVGDKADFDALAIDKRDLTQEQIEILKGVYKNDFYPVKDAKEMMAKALNTDDPKLFNSPNLKKVGYTLRNGGYIKKAEIPSLEEYMRNMVLNNDYYEFSREMNRLGSTYCSYVSQFMYDKLMFKIDKDKFITMKKLNKLGITTDDIDEFINKLEEIIPNEQFFNLYTLNLDFESKVLDLEFPDCFYESIINIMPNIKTISIDNKTIFKRTTHLPANKEKFLESFINNDKVYIDEIREAIKEKYNLDLSNEYLRQIINRKKFSYDSSTGCIRKIKEKKD